MWYNVIYFLKLKKHILYHTTVTYRSPRHVSNRHTTSRTEVTWYNVIYFQINKKIILKKLERERAGGGPSLGLARRLLASNNPTRLKTR